MCHAAYQAARDGAIAAVDAANDSVQLRAGLEQLIEDLKTISPYAYNDVIERLRQIMNGEIER